MKRSIVVHPFLFAIFPIAFSLANNMDQFLVSVSFGPLLAVSGVVLLWWLLLGFVLRSWSTAGLIISLFVLLFFSYEAVYYEIRDYAVSAGLSRIGTRQALVAAWVSLFAEGAYWLVRTRRGLGNLTYISNVISACAVGISVVNIGVHDLRAGSVSAGGAPVRERHRAARRCPVHTRIVASLGRGSAGQIRHSLGCWFPLPADDCGPARDGKGSGLAAQLLLPSPRGHRHRLVDQSGQDRHRSGLDGDRLEALEMRPA